MRETATTCDKGHGRVERRTLTSTTDLNAFLDWPGLQQVCRIQRERVIGERRESRVLLWRRRDVGHARNLIDSDFAAPQP